MEFYHPKPERFAEICQRIFPYTRFEYQLAQRTIPIPALLNYTGYPLAVNQYCFRHKGNGGKALWTYQNEDGEWFFKCVASECGIKGDVVEMWYQMVRLSGFAPPCWNREQACGDLLTRAERGMINLNINELAETHHGAQYPPGPKDEWQSRLKAMVGEAGPPKFQCEAALPQYGVQISIRQALMGLFPDDGLLLITPKVEWQSCNIFRRDVWLSSRYREACQCSYMSSNYLSRADMKCSRAGIEGIKRRWLVLEDDELSLEQQMWVHRELGKRYRLCCVCFSGGKSLHGWYLVEGMSEEQCFELYAEAIRLGIRETNTWRMSQPVRLPGGWNNVTQKKQRILLWHL